MTSTGPKCSSFDWEWLGRIDYSAAEALQQRYERRRAAGECRDRLLLLEHPHVITLGRSAQATDILVPTARLEENHVAIRRSDRGGQVTYHGPGQLVGYLIFDLYARKWSVPRFVWLVEEGLRRWFQMIGLDVERRCSRPGLWYREAKIASLGFHISRGISRHGFAINVAPDLRYFDWIIPCGAKRRTTSVEELLSRRLKLTVAAASVADCLDQVFSMSSAAATSSLPASDELESVSSS